MRIALATLALTTALSGTALAQGWPAAWTKPAAPYRIVGNVWYVGTEGIASYLISGSQGHIVIDGGMPEGAPLVEANIRKLGFKLEDVKILLNTHAHIDHAGGLAQLKADTKAKLYAAKGDEEGLEKGAHIGDSEYGGATFPPVKVDRTIKDLQVVKLGEIAVTAHVTPGHTRGCTTWTLPVVERDRPLNVTFYCSTSVAGNVLFGNKAYPQILADYEASFAKLRLIPTDVFLPNHPEFADLPGKRQRQIRGEPNPYIDPAEMGRFIDASQRAFGQELAKQERRR
ncbi:subclass B3 metallo-beta-lactamase [Caulobacter segnis]|uniref:subclass B3 metallo-beta-lactamase n=1 Tax=Caulobacter segnis TaxID=88688 RepID=UPI00240F534F|nr:subclass B3 metallo-beta-lactamase [Caulobacter segnis]MDG2522795.1 subclass B3 metallo-beta-lactamase [Caulobacter segnis]